MSTLCAVPYTHKFVQKDAGSSGEGRRTSKGEEEWREERKEAKTVTKVGK